MYTLTHIDITYKIDDENIPYSTMNCTKGSFLLRGKTHITGRFFTVLATREAPQLLILVKK